MQHYQHDKAFLDDICHGIISEARTNLLNKGLLFQPSQLIQLLNIQLEPPKAKLIELLKSCYESVNSYFHYTIRGRQVLLRLEKEAQKNCAILLNDLDSRLRQREESRTSRELSVNLIY